MVGFFVIYSLCFLLNTFGVMRKILKIAVYIISILVILISAGIILGRVYEKQILTFVVGELNKSLKTKIVPGEISFSFIKQFPKASVHFKNIAVFSSRGFKAGTKLVNGDTLLFARNLYLNFNLKKLIYKQFEMDGLNLRDGFVHILTNSMGKTNYDFFETNAQDTSSGFNIDLKVIKLKNTQLVYYDGTSASLVQVFMPAIKIKGNLSDESFKMATSGDLLLQKIWMDGKMKRFDFPAGFQFSVAVANNKFDIQNGILKLEDNTLHFSGLVENNKTTRLNLLVNADNLHLAPLMKHLEPEFLHGMQADGYLSFSAQIKGNAGDGKLPFVQVNFVGTKAWLLSEKYGKLLAPLVKGQYVLNGNRFINSSKIQVDTLVCQYKESYLKGRFRLQNFSRPQVLLDATLSGKLSDFQLFLPDNNILSGSFFTKVVYKGAFSDFSNLHWNTITKQNFRLEGKLEQTIVQLPKMPVIQVPYSEFSCTENSLQIQKTEIQIKSQKVLISYAETNTQNLLNDKKPLGVYAKMEAESFDYDAFYEFFPETGTSDSSRQMNADIDFKTNSFIFDSIAYTDFSGKLFYSDSRVEIQDIKTKIWNGSATGWIRCNFNEKEQTSLAMGLLVRNLDVRQMFEAYHNFDQDVLQAGNLKGLCDARLDFTCNLDKDYKPVYPSIVSEIDVSLKNGELIDFKYLNKLSLFIDVNEVKHIRFSEWNNTIYIRDNVIYLPQTAIKSNAINLNLAGQHSFDNVFTYNISVLLSDLLWKKSKWSQNNDQEFGIVEDPEQNKTTLHLLLQGDANDFRFSFDRAKAKEGIKAKIKEEKQTIKQILKEEFKLFKNDTSLNQKPKANNPPKFKIEWEELDTLP